jgi:uncharacterized protein YndB with AHSA1/START domain
MPEEKQRKVDVKLDINAKKEDIWSAITEGEEMQRWLAPKVKVAPGEGGSIFISWGAGAEGTAKIDVWKPGEHLRTVADPSKPTLQALEASGYTGPTDMVIDWLIETKDGMTTLRLVQSGFGDSSDWDHEYNGTNIGWNIFLRNLRHILVYHPGKTPIGLTFPVMTPLPVEEVWRRVTGPEGLVAKGSLAGLREGDRYSIETAAGERLEGVVSMWTEGKGFLVTVESLNNALIGLSVVAGKAPNNMTFGTWGALLFDMSAERAEEIRTQWSDFFQKLLTS